MDKEKGVSLIIIFFMMMVIISVILSVSVLLYSEIKIIRNMAGSVISFYSADSGVEKVLYYDRHTAVAGGTRGLCAICSTCLNPDGTQDLSLGCTDCLTHDNSSSLDGCLPSVCDDCTISFASYFDEAKIKTYTVTATVSPKPSGGSNDIFDIRVVGKYYDVGRAINVLNGNN